MYFCKYMCIQTYLPPFALHLRLRHFFKAVGSGDQLTEQAEAGPGLVGEVQVCG